MAAALLRHQSSIAYYENKHSGCMWGLFRFLDLQGHSHKRKMLSYRLHGEGTKHLTSEPSFASIGQEPLIDKEANHMMENKVKVVKKSSSKAHMINLLYRKLTKKRSRKLKLSSSESRLLRTISMHHLECNDYVLPDGVTFDSESSTAEPTSHETFFPEKSEQIAHSLRDSLMTFFNKQSDVSSISNTTKESSKDMVSMEGIKTNNNRTLLTRLKDFKKRIKDAIKENKKEERRISMDGVLDKIPVGQKRAEDLDKEKGSQSRDSQRMKFGSERFIYNNNKFADKSFQRSRSLTESLDRYSHLLESISVKEPQRAHVRLNSMKEQENNNAQRRILRSRSLTELFDRYTHLLETFPVREPKKQPERLKSIREDDALFDKRPLKTFGRILSIPETKLSSLSNKVQEEMLDAVNSSDELKPGGNLEEKMDTDTIEIKKHESDHIERFVASGGLVVEDSNSISQADDEDEITEDSNDKHIKASPDSVLDSHFEEHPVSPAKYVVTQGEEQDLAQNSEISLVEGSSDILELTDTHNVNSSQHKEEAEFNYVKDILRKSGFDGGADEFLEAWYSSYEPVDQLLFLEGEDEHETMKDEAFEDHQLLLDLINEILLEIYGNTIAHTIGLSRFNPRMRTMMGGDYVLDDVQAKVSRQLGSQEYMNLTLEQVVVRDFAKDDGWMKLIPDIESVGLQLEGLILEDLIEEIIEDYGDM